MNELLSDFVNNSVLFFGSFALIIIGVIVILASTLRQKKKVPVEVMKKVVEEHPLTFDELNKKEDKTDIEALLAKMQSDIDNRNNEIEEFESDQEENAIISYQELIKKAKKEEVKEEIKEESQVQKFVDQIKGNSSDKKFKNSEFISPIYGRVKAPEFVEKPNTPIIKATRREREIETLDIDFNEDIKSDDFLEKTINLEPLKNEIKHNDEFLKALKEFRNNL